MYTVKIFIFVLLIPLLQHKTMQQIGSTGRMYEDSDSSLSGFLPVLAYNPEADSMQPISSVSTWCASWHTEDRGTSQFCFYITCLFQQKW